MDKLKIKVNGEFKQVPISALENDLNFISDENYIHTDNNYTDEDKEKLESLENITIDGKNIPYKDECGYGTPDNMQDALDFAFEELDNRPTHDALGNNVAFSYKQNKTDTEKDRARENIGISETCVFHHKSQNLSEVRKRIARENIGVRGIIDLGEIDLNDYQGDISRFLDTLTENNIYIFYDSEDNFYWLVDVYRMDNGSMGQEYWNTEEGYLSKYYREGYYDEDEDMFVLNNETQYLTPYAASLSYATKNHSHFSTISTSKDIRAYLGSYTNYTVKDLRVTSSANKHVYITKVDYNHYSTTSGMRYVRYQEYYDIEEPNKIYKRMGTGATSSFSSAITWGDWYVFEGVSE